MKISNHAKLRQQQRGIPPIVVDLLIEFGATAQAGSHATTHYFDKKSRRRLQVCAGRLSSLLEEYMDYYAVVASDGRLITVAPRIRRLQH